MFSDDYTDGDNNIELGLGDIPSADMDDIHDMISERIQRMILADLRDLDLGLDLTDFSININSLDISVDLNLEEQQ